jgi:hypothetical protein
MEYLQALHLIIKHGSIFYFSPIKKWLAKVPGLKEKRCVEQAVLKHY